MSKPAGQRAWMDTARILLAKLRTWQGTIVAIATASVEHWLGETIAVAALTAGVVVSGAILWRRVSLLMATGGGVQNCTKAYAVEARLVNYMQIMAPLAPIVTANQFSTTNAQFLAGLSKLASQTAANASITNSNSALTTADANAINGVINAVNILQSHLQGDGFEV